MRARRLRPPLLGEAAVVLALVVVYDRIRDLAATRADLAFGNAIRLLHWEVLVGLDVEHPMNAVLAAHPTLQAAAAWYYQLAHLTVTLAVLLWCYWRRPDAYRGARNALLLVNATSLVVFWLIPVAPPRLLPGAGYIDSGVVSGVASRATSVTPDLYAAMPSLHFAWAAWVAVVVARTVDARRQDQAWPAGQRWARLRERPWARVLAAVHVTVTAVVVIATGNHYVLDLAAGGMLAMAAVWAADQSHGATRGRWPMPRSMVADATSRSRRPLRANARTRG